MLKKQNQSALTPQTQQLERNSALKTPVKKHLSSSPDRDSERHSEIDNEEIVLDINDHQDEGVDDEEEEDSDLAQMRLIEEEKSKAIQSVFRDLISQVNKMNDVLVPPSPINNVGKSPYKESPVKSACKMGEKENSTKKLRRSIGEKINNLSPPGKRLTQTLGLNNPQEGVLLAIFNMVMEIKSQTSYIVEKQSDLEYLVTQDLKPTLEDGLTKIRQDIRRLNGVSKVFREAAPKSIKRKTTMTANLPREKGPIKEPKNSQFVKSEKNLVMLPVQTNQFNEAPQTMAPQRPNLGTELQANMIVNIENDCTFLRKFDLTELKEQQNVTLEESIVESIGTSLIKIIKENNSNPQQDNLQKPKPKRNGMRNFNFKCNLEEIDKIIEEDIQELNVQESTCLISIQSPDKLQKANSEQPPLEIISEINKSIKEEGVSQEDMKRPSTGRKKPRQVMGINNINFHKGPHIESKALIENIEIEENHKLREKSKTPNKRDGPSPLKAQQVQEVLQVIENATGAVRRIGTAIPNAFAGVIGNRFKKLPTSKVEDDPILALLQSEDIEEINDNQFTQLPASSPINNQNQAITPRKARALQIKRQAVGAAFFRAPPVDLIESILQDDQEVEVNDVSPTASKNEDSAKLRVNNFMDKSPTREGGTERSPINIRKVSPMIRRNNAIIKPILNLGGINLDQSDDEITNSEKKKMLGENPFNEGNANSKQEANHQDNMRNLFFHQRSAQKDGQETGMTGDFGK